jgi:hypothetical protein
LNGKNPRLHHSDAEPFRAPRQHSPTRRNVGSNPTAGSMRRRRLAARHFPSTETNPRLCDSGARSFHRTTHVLERLAVEAPHATRMLVRIQPPRRPRRSQTGIGAAFTWRFKTSTASTLRRSILFTTTTTTHVLERLAVEALHAQACWFESNRLDDRGVA